MFFPIYVFRLFAFPHFEVSEGLGFAYTELSDKSGKVLHFPDIETKRIDNETYLSFSIKTSCAVRS